MDNKLENRIARLERMMNRKSVKNEEDFVTQQTRRILKVSYIQQILKYLDSLISRMNDSIEFQVENGYIKSDVTDQMNLYINDLNDMRDYFSTIEL